MSDFLPCGTIAEQGAFLLGVNELNGVNNQIKPGCCAHGLPAGACPVCSQSGGGTLRQSDRNRKVGEMTYHECAMIGNMMKARALAQKKHEANLKLHALNVQQFETAMAKIAQNMELFIKTLPQSFISKPIAFILTVTILPIVNIIQNIPKIFQTLNNLRFEIADKLAAIYGEAKAFLHKKTEEFARIISKPFEWIAKIFKKNNSDDEDTKIDDDKKIFNLKTILHKVKEKFKNRKDKQNEHGTENQ